MKDTVFARLWAVIFYPSAVMEAVRDYPRWSVAGLVIVLLVGLYSGLTLHITGPENMEMIRETRLGQMLDTEDWQQRSDEMMNPSARTRVGNGVQAGVATLVSLLVMSLVYMLVSRLAGGQGTFNQILGVTFWAGVVGTGLAAIVKLPLVLLKGTSLDVVLGPAVFFSGRGPTDFWFQLFSLLDLFTIWSVVLVAVGFEKIHEFDRNKALSVSISASLVVGLIMFGLGRLFI